MAREQRRTSFGGVAPLYDRARPSYPPALVDDVIGLAPMGDDARAVEVGAGTGKATALFAARGVSVHALEPLPEMAALAEHNCADYPDVTIEVVEFERWDRGGRTFPLLYSAQAWHWIDPGRRYCAARAALEPGGVLAAFWNRAAWGRSPLRAELEEAYARNAPALGASGPMRPSRWRSADVSDRWEEEIDPSDGSSSRHSAVMSSWPATRRRSTSSCSRPTPITSCSSPVSAERCSTELPE